MFGKKEKYLAVVYIILISLFMCLGVFHRPLAYISNEITQVDTLSLVRNMTITQEMQVCHDDRKIQDIFIKFDGTLEDTDVINVVISSGEAEKIWDVTKADINSDGWYKLACDFDTDGDTIYLTLSTKELSGNIAVCLSQDIDNLGAFSVNGNKSELVLTSRIAYSIMNYVWGGGYKWLIAIYTFAALAIVYFIRNEEDRKNDTLLFGTSTVLNILGMYIFVPYLFRCPQIAENALNFYYLTSRYNVWKCLFMSDAGYLPLSQRLIAILFIKILGLGSSSLYFMQATGIILDAMMAAAICLYAFRNLGTKTTRFVISLMVAVLFAHSTVSTYFNFIYLGYFIILLVLCGNIQEFKKWQFVLICIASMLMCLSKGFYVVFFPFGAIMLLLCKDVLMHREKVYVRCLTIASGIQLLYAACHGGISKWISFEKSYIAICILGAIILVLGLLVFCFVIPWIRKWVKKICSNNPSILKVGMTLILMIGSFLLTFIALHGNVTMTFIMNWGNAWCIPCSCAVLVCLALLGSCTCGIRKYLSYAGLLCYGVIALCYSSEKCTINYNCADWTVYKEYFARTIVPVFRDDERFGTMADNLVLCYSDMQPADNYEYGAPYMFEKINIAQSADKVVSQFILPEKASNRVTDAIYLNYPGDVGNSEVYLECFNSEGELIDRKSQITPLSLKTIGFIFDEGVNGISSLKVKTQNGRDVFVENHVILAQRK